jgi:hypothetical protein
MPLVPDHQCARCGQKTVSFQEGHGGVCSGCKVELAASALKEATRSPLDHDELHAFVRQLGLTPQELLLALRRASKRWWQFWR